MTKFAVGDKVRVIDNIHGGLPYGIIGMEGIVKAVHSFNTGYPYRVSFGGPRITYEALLESELELVPSITPDVILKEYSID